MRRHLVLAVLAASLASGVADAATYPAIYSFGDSLSDGGNVFTSTFSTFPKFPYEFGRFSNGLNWLDDLTAKLGLGPLAVPSLNGGNDFAFGGAQTGTTIVSNNPLVPTLGSQVDLFFKTQIPSPTPGALYTLDIGGNDILNAVTALSAGKISLNDMMTTFLNAAVTNTVGAVKDLYGDGMRSLLYYEVPDLSVVPDYKTLGSQFAADAGTLAMDFNTDVLQDIKTLDLSGLTVFDVPTFSAIDKIVANLAPSALSTSPSPAFLEPSTHQALSAQIRISSCSGTGSIRPRSPTLSPPRWLSTCSRGPQIRCLRRSPRPGQ